MLVKFNQGLAALLILPSASEESMASPRWPTCIYKVENPNSLKEHAKKNIWILTV